MAIVPQRPRTTTTSVEAIRAAVRERHIANAISKIASKLDAKETRFFTYQGQVVETATVEDHSTQLKAAEQLASMAGLFSRERVAPEGEAQVAMEYDSKTGVMRIIVGAPGVALRDEQEVAALQHDVLEAEGVANQLDLPLAEREPDYELIKIKGRPGELPDDIKKLIFGDSMRPTRERNGA